MLRLFPLLSVTIIFFLIFSSVRNLTVKNDIQVTEENKDFLKNEMKVSPKSTFKDNMIDQLDTKNSNLSENSVKDVQNKKIESDLNTNLNKSIEYKEKKSGQRVQKKNNAELKIIEKKETISADKVKNSNATYLKSDGKKIKNEKKVIKDVKVQSNEYRIQFGAFSKKSNAEESKVKIQEKLKNTYPSLKLQILHDKNKNFYRILTFVENKELAENICNFSKIQKIGCLAIKK